jgi:pterin-4a-carbinolamine dehydratase
MSNLLLETANRLLKENDKLTMPVNSSNIVKISKRETPVIATEKWIVKEKHLCKKFHFFAIEDRNLFMLELLNYEAKTGHNARFIVTEDYISVALITKNVNSVTELDKEYSRFADSLYRDVSYAEKD